MTLLARRTLATGDKAICLDCRGTGDHGRCRACNGKGAVCPSCHGMRFFHLRKRTDPGYTAGIWDGNAQQDLVRCMTCCEGNQVNEDLEVRAIRAYIARSDAITGPTLVRDAQEGK